MPAEPARKTIDLEAETIDDERWPDPQRRGMRRNCSHSFAIDRAAHSLSRLANAGTRETEAASQHHRLRVRLSAGVRTERAKRNRKCLCLGNQLPRAFGE